MYRKTSQNAITEYQTWTNSNLLSESSGQAETSERLDIGEESCFFRLPDSAT